MEAIVCSTVHPFVHISFLENVDCNEVWFEASDFSYTINTGSSWRILLDILLLPCVREILQLVVVGMSLLCIQMLNTGIHGCP